MATSIGAEAFPLEDLVLQGLGLGLGFRVLGMAPHYRALDSERFRYSGLQSNLA